VATLDTTLPAYKFVHACENTKKKNEKNPAHICMFVCICMSKGVFFNFPALVMVLHFIASLSSHCKLLGSKTTQKALALFIATI